MGYGENKPSQRYSKWMCARHNRTQKVGGHCPRCLEEAKEMSRDERDRKVDNKEEP